MKDSETAIYAIDPEKLREVIPLNCLAEMAIALNVPQARLAAWLEGEATPPWLKVEEIAELTGRTRPGS